MISVSVFLPMAACLLITCYTSTTRTTSIRSSKLPASCDGFVPCRYEETTVLKPYLARDFCKSSRGGRRKQLAWLPHTFLTPHSSCDVPSGEG